MSQSNTAAAPRKRVKQRSAKTRRPLNQTRFWANRYIHIMVAITVIYFLVFRYWPLAWISIAFKDYKILRGFADSTWVGWRNFERIFSNMPYFMNMIRNTLALNILSIVFAFPAPIIFALLINEVRGSSFKRSVQTISYLPHFLSTVVVVGIATTFLSPSMGALNKLLVSLGGDRIKDRKSVV